MTNTRIDLLIQTKNQNWVIGSDIRILTHSPFGEQCGDECDDCLIPQHLCDMGIEYYKQGYRLVKDLPLSEQILANERFLKEIRNEVKKSEYGKLLKIN